MKSIIAGAVASIALVACLSFNSQAKIINLSHNAVADTGKMAKMDKMKMDKMKMDKMKMSKMSKDSMKMAKKMSKKKMAKDTAGKM